MINIKYIRNLYKIYKYIRNFTRKKHRIPTHKKIKRIDDQKLPQRRNITKKYLIKMLYITHHQDLQIKMMVRYYFITQRLEHITKIKMITTSMDAGESSSHSWLVGMRIGPVFFFSFFFL